jgi:predicted CxxxxCH...CXXCH cytochrome family protein
VRPLRHVNGRRDVVFDARLALPAISWLPASPNTPTRPYWVTNAAPGVTFPDPAVPDAVMDGATMSLYLASATYDSATKTCATVACHLAQTQVTWGAPQSWAACSECHPF